MIVVSADKIWSDQLEKICEIHCHKADFEHESLCYGLNKRTLHRLTHLTIAKRLSTPIIIWRSSLGSQGTFPKGQSNNDV